MEWLHPYSSQIPIHPYTLGNCMHVIVRKNRVERELHRLQPRTHTQIVDDVCACANILRRKPKLSSLEFVAVRKLWKSLQANGAVRLTTLLTTLYGNWSYLRDLSNTTVCGGYFSAFHHKWRCTWNGNSSINDCHDMCSH